MKREIDPDRGAATVLRPAALRVFV